MPTHTGEETRVLAISPSLFRSDVSSSTTVAPSERSRADTGRHQRENQVEEGIKLRRGSVVEETLYLISVVSECCVAQTTVQAVHAD